jgi:epoxyqueuosine reductase
LRRRAHELGFHRVGCARVAPLDPEARLQSWLARGYQGPLDYMARTAAERADVDRVLPGARTVIVLAVSYYRQEYQPSLPFRVSRYAAGRDYHGVIRRRIRKLRRSILEWVPEARVKPSIDTSPVWERAWAARAGVAWIGKSTMALSTDLGTYFFLATLITDAEFVTDSPVEDRCGSCTACLDACPTDAFVEPRLLDARRCITTWNVEDRDTPADAMPELHDWLAGCDVCQEVCPWNKFARHNDDPAFAPLAWAHPSDDLPTQSEAEIADQIRGTALQRTGASAIRRNAQRIARARTTENERD